MFKEIRNILFLINPKKAPAAPDNTPEVYESQEQKEGMESGKIIDEIQMKTQNLEKQIQDVRINPDRFTRGFQDQATNIESKLNEVKNSIKNSTDIINYSADELAQFIGDIEEIESVFSEEKIIENEEAKLKINEKKEQFLTKKETFNTDSLRTRMMEDLNIMDPNSLIAQALVSKFNNADFTKDLENRVSQAEDNISALEDMSELEQIDSMINDLINPMLDDMDINNFADIDLLYNQFIDEMKMVLDDVNKYQEIGGEGTYCSGAKRDMEADVARCIEENVDYNMEQHKQNILTGHTADLVSEKLGEDISPDALKKALTYNESQTEKLDKKTEKILETIYEMSQNGELEGIDLVYRGGADGVPPNMEKFKDPKEMAILNNSLQEILKLADNGKLEPGNTAEFIKDNAYAITNLEKAINEGNGADFLTDNQDLFQKLANYHYAYGRARNGKRLYEQGGGIDTENDMVYLTVSNEKGEEYRYSGLHLIESTKDETPEKKEEDNKEKYIKEFVGALVRGHEIPFEVTGNAVKAVGEYIDKMVDEQQKRNDELRKLVQKYTVIGAPYVQAYQNTVKDLNKSRENNLRQIVKAKDSLIKIAKASVSPELKQQISAMQDKLTALEDSIKEDVDQVAKWLGGEKEIAQN